MMQQQRPSINSSEDAAASADANGPEEDQIRLGDSLVKT